MSPSYINNLVSVKSCSVYSLRILHYFFTVHFLPFSSFILCCCPHTVEPFDRFNVKRCYIKWINYYYYSHWLYQYLYYLFDVSLNMETAWVSPIPKTDYPQRERLPPSIYSVGSFKSVWAVSAETINFLQWWAFFIGTKYIWSGFRKGHSIITALLGIRDDIRAMKRGEVSLMVFADYSEAFDTVLF